MCARIRIFSHFTDKTADDVSTKFGSCMYYSTTLYISIHCEVKDRGHRVKKVGVVKYISLQDVVCSLELQTTL